MPSRLDRRLDATDWIHADFIYRLSRTFDYMDQFPPNSPDDVHAAFTAYRCYFGFAYGFLRYTCSKSSTKRPIAATIAPIIFTE